MNEDFAPFELAKKLKEKGYPQVEKNTLAMYDEDGCLSFLCPTFDVNRCYYVFDDFDEDDCVCPTISQASKWLREKYFIHISTKPYICKNGILWLYEIRKFSKYMSVVIANKTGLVEEEQASLEGIEYVIDNLI